MNRTSLRSHLLLTQLKALEKQRGQLSPGGEEQDWAMSLGLTPALQTESWHQGAHGTSGPAPAFALASDGGLDVVVQAHVSPLLYLLPK